MLACAGAARPATTAAATKDVVVRTMEDKGIKMSYQN
jgi:hypothetical protein